MSDGTERNRDIPRFRNKTVPIGVATVTKRYRKVSDQAISLPMEAPLTRTKRFDLVVGVGGP